MNETFNLDNICTVLVILLVYELVYFNIMEIVSWIIFLLNFLCKVDSYESTSRVYESSLLDSHESK